MKFDYQNYKVISNSIFKSKYPNVHSSLNLHYPIGLKLYDEKYRTYVGQISVNELIRNNIESNEAFNNKWVNGFLKNLSQKTNYSVEDITYGLVPNFGGKIILNKSEDLRYSTELLFFVSLINNFYSIQIVYTDKYITYKQDFLPDKTGFGIKKIITSPVDNEFGELFNQTSELIESEFDNAKFLPFRFDLLKLKNFEVPNNYSKDSCTVISKAFFHKGKLLNEGTKIIGDVDYKLNKV